MNRTISITLVSLFAATAAQAGCNQSDTSSVDGLHFTANSLDSLSNAGGLNLTLYDPVASQNIYAATEALPLYPDTRELCPGDIGTRYSIDFFMGPETVANAVLNPEGCEDVTITNAGEKSIRAVRDLGYWSTLAKNLGVPESEIFPVAP